MSQQTILKLLKKSKKPISAKEITEKLPHARSSVNHNLRRLVQQKDIKFVYHNIRTIDDRQYVLTRYFFV